MNNLPFIVFASVLTGLIIGIQKERRKLLTSRVMRTSKRYRATRALNEEYTFDDTLQDIYHYTETLNTKSQFDRFNFDEHLLSKVGQELEGYYSWIQRVRRNQSLFDQYLYELSRIPGETTPREARTCKVPYRFYHLKEKELCAQTTLCPVVVPRIIYHATYTSLMGRNSYSRRKEYTFDEMIRMYETALKRREIKNTAEYQRRQVTPSLRYDILKRDHFRCVLCGRSQEDGIKLHVDHIIPVSKGGKTVPSNLRTLCDECNLGKRDKYDADGWN